MKEWLKPEITESEAGMEVTSYLPAELDRAYFQSLDLYRVCWWRPPRKRGPSLF